MSDRFVRTYKRRKIFLDQLAAGNSVSFAARAAGGTPTNFKKWRQTDPDFDKDWEEALEEGTDFIEDVATERALKKSDALMAMILKARRPEKFDRGGKLELTGNLNVEGAKSKLLNKIARLQAAGAISASSDQSESSSSGDQGPEAEPEIKALPAPEPSPGDVPERGSKRRGIAGSNRRKAAA